MRKWKSGAQDKIRTTLGELDVLEKKMLKEREGNLN